MATSPRRPCWVDVTPLSHPLSPPFPDMAKRIANLLRVVLSLQHSPEPLSDGSPELHRVPLRLLAPHVGRLPMPEDYALEELRGLTQSYLRELTVVTQ